MFEGINIMNHPSYLHWATELVETKKDGSILFCITSEELIKMWGNQNNSPIIGNRRFKLWIREHKGYIFNVYYHKTKGIVFEIVYETEDIDKFHKDKKVGVAIISFLREVIASIE